MLFTLGLSIVLGGTVGAAFAYTDWRLPPAVEQALLQENWSAVRSRLGNSTPLSVPAKALLAHAALAQNKNDTAVCLFLEVSSPGAATHWVSWATGFADAHPTAAIAHYFHGDGLARMQRWEPARQAFDQALALQSDHPLVLNARGAVWAALQEWNLALSDFEQAATAQPALADAQANLSSWFLQQGIGPDGAHDWASRALKLAGNFTLALNNRASAGLALGQWGAAQADFQTARTSAACADVLLAANAERIAAYMAGDPQDTRLALASADDAGTTLDRKLADLTRRPNSQGAMNGFVNALRGQSPELRQQYVGRMQDLGRGNPNLAQKWSKTLQQSMNWNRSTGPAEFFNSFLPSRVGVKTPKGGVDIGGVSIGKHQQNVTRQNYTIAHDLYKTLPSNTVGGVYTDTRHVHRDTGDWPFVTYYGLLYQPLAH